MRGLFLSWLVLMLIPINSFALGGILYNTVPFFLIDFRRFEPACQPNFESRWIYQTNRKLCIGARITRTDSEWLRLLGSERYNVMRNKGTERPYSGIYLSEERKGIYRCAACEEPLFKSENKYREPNSGWPSFTQPFEPKKVYYLEDKRLSFKRYEVLCRQCDSHLGHIFKDGPPPKHFRYTINSIALIFECSD